MIKKKNMELIVETRLTIDIYKEDKKFMYTLAKFSKFSLCKSKIIQSRLLIAYIQRY